jgi:hypothetical protein
MIGSMTTRIAGFRGEFLWELEIVIRQSVAMAEAIPAEKYDWRPNTNARSISEVFVHVATGNFMLLDAIGISAPMDLFMQLPANRQERFPVLMRRNDELVTTVRDKNAVVALVKRSLQVVNRSFIEAGYAELGRGLNFFGEDTTVRRVYLRLLAHAHEYMGQMIAYLRFTGIPIPWPDWRPDRRTQN